MKAPVNIQEISYLKPDFMGFIFYPKSKRFVHMKTIANQYKKINDKIEKVAVFVNESAENIHHEIRSYGFDFIQLHGNESPETIAELKTYGYKIIKAFSVKDGFDFKISLPYEDLCDYFLFDTATPLYGGSGSKFNWNILSQYQGNTPFLLSGGIHINDSMEIKKLKHPQLIGVDVNSGFEIEPGLKDIDLLKKFIKEIKE